MPEIGETLREARMRRRIDMTEVETATKIRGKYLRALENEEWDLLPGPTFVKTFLRTYAEYLDLDARLLVEQYRQRYERPSTQDLTPFSAGRSRGRVGRRRASMGPGLVLGGCALLLVAALYLLGSWPLGEEEPSDPSTVGEATATPEGSGGSGSDSGSDAGSGSDERRRQRPERVRLQLVATAPVYVCVVDARGRQVIDEETLAADTTTRTLRSKRFLTNFGNDNVRMRVNGRTYRVAASADPIGYELLPGRRPRRLSDARRPDCSS
jgi:cytoskeleton protein RodZ